MKNSTDDMGKIDLSTLEACQEKLNDFLKYYLRIEKPRDNKENLLEIVALHERLMALLIRLRIQHATKEDFL